MSTIYVALDKKETVAKSDHGIIENVSVLDKRFMTEINFLQYSTFPIHEQQDSPIQQEWLQEVKILCFDLEVLLSFSHDKFWVQLVHDSTLHAMLSTYLQKAPRSWDIWDIPESFKSSHDKLHRLVFMTLLRISTDKESKECFLTPEAFGFAIYENYMFDIPKLIDICSLYGHPHGGNGIMVNKMLTNVFTKQQSYAEDLKLVSKQICDDIIDSITSKFSAIQTTIGLYDLLYYHYDTCMSLICLFSTYPPTLNYFIPNELITSFATLYHHMFYDIKAKLKRLSTPTCDLRSFKTMINRAQLSTVRLIHCVMWYSCVMDQLLDNEMTAEEHTRIAEQFIAQVSVILDDCELITKYYQECNLAKTFAIIQASKAEIGPDHFDYILNAIDIETRKGVDINEIEKVHYNACNRNPILQDAHCNGDANGDKNMPSEEHMAFLVDNIKNIFPQYSNDFLERCLTAYSYSTEDVITAMVEDNLPPHLVKLQSTVQEEMPGPAHSINDEDPGPSNQQGTSSVQRSQHNTAPSPSSIAYNNTASEKKSYSLVVSRQNVFDNDEFDAFNNPHELNFEQIHMGKKDKVIREESESTKDFILKNPKFNFEYDEYEDEYDDTYDGVIATAGDGTLSDQAMEFVIKPLNTHIEASGEDYDSKDDESGQNILGSDNRPGSHRGRGRGKHPQNQQPRQVDKVGQKADSKTLINRNRNERNKSSRANHNRRAGADKKRRGGMLHM